MNSSPSLCDTLRQLSASQGFNLFGIAGATAIPQTERDTYESFIARGRHAGMEYLEKYTDIRSNPSLLLDGNANAKSIIAVAASYYTPTPQPNLRWARYALGQDYHNIIRARLRPLADLLIQKGHQARICVDTAPLREKYWAVKAGLGTIGLNTLLLTEIGSYVLLGFIVTDAQLPPSAPLTESLCTKCGACIRSCPGKALAEGTIDARRCNSYLTIESRQPLPENLRLGRRIYGCDICQEACPANRNPLPATIPELLPNPRILGLTPDDIAALTPETYAETFRGSAIKRAKLSGLLRNLKSL